MRFALSLWDVEDVLAERVTAGRTELSDVGRTTSAAHWGDRDRRWRAHPRLDLCRRRQNDRHRLGMNGRDLGDRLRRQERLSLFGYGDRSVTGLADTADNRSNRPRVLVVGAFSAIYVLWGSTYLAIAIAVQTIPPFLLIGIRSLGAGAILLGVAQLQKPGMPPVRAWALAAASGILLFGGCHGTLAYDEKSVSSGLAAVMLATIPFWIVRIKLAISADDRPKPMTLAALVPGLVGVALFMLPADSQWTAPIAPDMALILLGSALLWAAGAIISQRQSPSISAMASAGMQLLCGGAALLVVSSLMGKLAVFSPLQVSIASWAGLGYLTFAGSVIAFTAYVWLLDHARSPLVATYTFVNPIIAVGLGWAALGERLTLPMLPGFGLVVGSVIAVWRLDAA